MHPMQILPFLSAALVLWVVIIVMRAQSVLFDLKFSVEAGTFAEACVAIRKVRNVSRNLCRSAVVSILYCLILWLLHLLHSGAVGAACISVFFSILTFLSRSNMHFFLRQSGYNPKSMEAAGIVLK